jgi:ketosteroid isomerase-like protein
VSQSPDSPAVTLARAHVQAWSTKDWDKARSMLAPDVHVIAMTTNPALPHTDLTGAEEYMQGLVAFADPIVPGSVRELASVGDERNALLTLDLRVAGGPFGAGAATPCARLYLVEDGKIKSEQVVFYVGQG